MADITIGRLVYEVVEVGLAQLKKELSELTSKPIHVTISGESKRGVSEITSEMQKLRNRVQGLRNEFAASNQDITKYTRALKDAQKEALELAKGLDRDSKAFVHLTGTAASAQRGIVSALRAKAMAVTPVQEQIAKLQNEVHGLRNQYIAVGGSSTQFAASMRRVRDDALRAAQGLSTTSKEFRQLQTVAAQAERAATSALGGISRLGLASQVQAGMGAMFMGMTRMMPGALGGTAYMAASLTRGLRGLNPIMAASTASVMALGGAYAYGTSQAARLQQQQRLLEAITHQATGAYDDLTRGIMEMSTRLPATAIELYDTAEVAAKLGIEGTENILAFSQSVQGLAFITNQSVGQMGSDLAKFMNEMGMTASQSDYTEQVARVANALAVAHTTTAAQAQEALQVSRYFAALGKQIGLTSGEIVSLSAAVAAVGGQSQSSGTAFSRFFLDMARAAEANNRQLEGMAEVAGMARHEFRELVRESPVEAFIAVARGIEAVQGSAGDTAWALDRLGQRNVRIINMLSQMASSGELFSDVLERINAAQEDSDYLTDIMSEAMYNLPSQLMLTGNALKGIFAIMSEPVVQMLTDRVRDLNVNLKELFDRFNSLNEEQLKAISTATGLVFGFVGVVAAAALVSKALAVLKLGILALGGIGAIVTSPVILALLAIAATVALVKKAWDDDWFHMRTTVNAVVEGIKTKWNELTKSFRDEEGNLQLPELEAPNWSEVVDSAREGVARSLERFRIFLRGGSEDIPEDEWEPLRFGLPRVSTPDWSETIDAAFESAKGAWEAVRNYFSGESGESLSLPGIKVPDWSGTIDAAKESLQVSVEEVQFYIESVTWTEWPTIEAPDVEVPDWSSMEPPEAVIQSVERMRLSFANLSETLDEVPIIDWKKVFPSSDLTEETQEIVSEAIAKGTQAALESPKGQVTLNIGRLAQEVMAGDKTIGEAIKEALESNIAVGLTSALIMLTPFGLGWKLALLGVSLGIKFLSDQDPEFEGTDSVIERIKRKLDGWLKELNPEIDVSEWVISLKGLPGLFATIGEDLATLIGGISFSDEVAELSEEAGLIAGDFAADLVTALTKVLLSISGAFFKLGWEFGRSVSGPFLKGFMEGFLDRIFVGLTPGDRNLAESRALTGKEYADSIAEEYVRTGELPEIEFSEDEATALVDYLLGLRDDGGSVSDPVPELEEAVEAVELFTESLTEVVEEIEKLSGDAASVMSTIIQTGLTSNIPSDLALVLAHQESSLLEHTGTGGPFQLRRLALQDLQAMGRGAGLSVVPGTQYVTGSVEDLVQGGFDFADLLVRRMNIQQPRVLEQMERLGISSAEAFSIAWVTGLEGFLRLSSLEDVITWVNGQPQTVQGRLDQMRRSMSHLGYDLVPLVPGFSYSSGTPWTGWGPLDEPAGVVHRREAVIPWDALRKGPGGVLEFLGAPGFQDGYLPPEVQQALAQGQGALQDMAGFTDGLVVFAEEMDKATGVLSGVRQRIEEWGPEVLGQSLYEDMLQLTDTLGSLGSGITGFLTDLRSAVNVLVHGAPPSEEASGTGGTDDGPGSDPAVTKTQWQQFLDWLKDEWEMVGLTVADWTKITTDALSSFTKGLDENAGTIAAVTRSLLSLARFDQDGRFDLRGTVRAAITSAVTMVAEALGSLITTTADSLMAQSNARIGPGEDILSIGRTFEAAMETERLMAERRALYEDLAAQHREIAGSTIGGAIGGAALGAALGFLIPGVGWLIGMGVGAAAGGYAGRKSAQDRLAEDMAKTQKDIADLDNLLTNYEVTLKQALGLTEDQFAGAIQRAFSATSFEDVNRGLGQTVAGFKTQLNDAVNSIVRGALIQQFIATVVTEPIKNLSEQIFGDIMAGTLPDMEAVRATIEGIEEPAKQFYEMLEELGLTGEKAADSLRGASDQMSNVPEVFKRTLRMFQVSEGIPSFATGGFVPPTPGGRIIRVAEAGEGEWIVPASKMGRMGQAPAPVINVDMRESVFYGDRDIDRKIRRSVAEAFQEARSVQYGV